MFQSLIQRYRTLSPAQQRTVVFCGVLLAGMLAALAVMVLNLLLKRAYYPAVTFLFDPRYRFGDFYDVASFAARGLDVYAQTGPNYFPFFMVLLLPLKYLPVQAALWGVSGVFVAFYAWLAYRLMPPMPCKPAWVAVFTVCSFPLLLALDRGNVEMLLFIVCGLFIYCYQKGYLKTAGLWLALAINMKLYPAVFLVLFAADKKYRELLLTLCLTAGFFALGYWLTGAGNKLGHNLAFFAMFYQQRPFGLQFSHSLMNIVRVPAFMSLDGGGPDTWGPFTQFSAEISLPYMLFVLALFAVICLYVVFLNPPRWKAVLLLTLAEIGFPFVSGDYTLVHLALPALLLLAAPGRQMRQTGVCVLLALLFIPMNFWSHTYYMTHYAMVLNAGSLVRPLLIVVLLAVLMQDFTWHRLKTGVRGYFTGIRP